MDEHTHPRDIILVPVDFEEPSLSALDLAKSLAHVFGAEIVLIHAYRLLVQTYPGLTPVDVPPWPGIHLEMVEAARKALNDLAAAHGGLRSILVEGDPARAILDEAARLRPRMIVMGSHGRAGIERLMLGSVAEKVVRRSPAPVTVAHGKASSSTASDGDVVAGTTADVVMAGATNHVGAGRSRRARRRSRLLARAYGSVSSARRGA
jgi:nucleotide-binding universal stress UspA family protein